MTTNNETSKATQIEELLAKIEALQQQASEADERISEFTSDKDDLAYRLDDAQSANEEMQREVGMLEAKLEDIPDLLEMGTELEELTKQANDLRDKANAPPTLQEVVVALYQKAQEAGATGAGAVEQILLVAATLVENALKLS